MAAQEILGGQYVAYDKYSAQFFQRFRSENIVELAVDYARVGWLLCSLCSLNTAFYIWICVLLPSVLSCCWLGGREGIRPVWWGAGVVICLERGADLHIAQLMLLPLTVSCFSKIQIGFTFLVLAHPSSPGQRAVKRVCVCVCVMLLHILLVS